MTATKRGAPRWRASRYGHAVITSELIRCTATPRGGRHNQIYATARRVGELVAGGEIDEDFARHRLVEMGRRLKPDEIGEITRAVNDGIRKGKLTPRSGAQPGVGIHIRNSTDAVLAIWAMADAVMANTRGWNSRTAGTDQRVLLALCSMAIRCYKTRFGVSVRQLAEEAGVGVATAHRSLVRLEGTWLRRTHIAGQRTSDDRTTVQLLVRKSYVEELTGEVGNNGSRLEAYGTAKGAGVPSLPQASWKPAGM